MNSTSRHEEDLKIIKLFKKLAFKSITNLLNSHFQQLPGLSNLKNLNNLPNIFINNIKKKFNLECFEYKISKLYCSTFYPEVKKANLKKLKNTVENFLIIEEIKKDHNQDKVLNMTLKEILDLYFNSQYLEKDFNQMKEKFVYRFKNMKLTSMKFLFFNFFFDIKISSDE
jgi:hypothetical protein